MPSTAKYNYLLGSRAHFWRRFLDSYAELDQKTRLQEPRKLWWTSEYSHTMKSQGRHFFYLSWLFKTMDHSIPTNFYSRPCEEGKRLVSTCSPHEVTVCYLHWQLVCPFEAFTFLFESQIFLPYPPLLKLSSPALPLWLNMGVMVVSASCTKQNHLLYLVLQDTFSRPQADLCISFSHPSFKPPKAEPNLLSRWEPRVCPVAQTSSSSIWV